MAFRTQRMVNRFPQWTKARKDKSSFASRMFSVWADYFDFRDMELLKTKNEFDLLKYHIGRPWVWKIPLDTSDELPVVITTGGVTTWTYPTTVTGTFNGSPQALTRVENLEDLLWSVPDELVLDETITVSEMTLWEWSSPLVYQPIESPERLIVFVEHSTDYFRRSQFKNVTRSGYHMIVLEGKDVNGQDVTEYVSIVDDGVYFTRNIFSELTNVEIEGLDGEVSIFLAAPITTLNIVNDHYHLAMDENVEGQLKLGWSTNNLQYFVQRIKAGANYRVGTIEADIVDNDELIWEQKLRKINGDPISDIQDFDFNPDTNRLYVLTEDNTLRVFDYGQNEFVPPVDEATLTTEAYVEVCPIKNWAVINEEMTIFTWFAKPRFPVLGITIKRRDPSGTVEYLQAGLTWAGATYEFLGKDATNQLAEDSWDDLTFTSIFDDYGQWELYCTARTAGGTSIQHYGVMVDSITALLEVSSVISGTPYAAWFSYDGRFSIANTINEIRKFKVHSHKYLANGPTQELFFREEYSSVEVTP